MSDTPRMKRAFVSIVAAASFATPHAFAQTEPAAEALFAMGRSLMKSGEIEQACVKFRESHRLEPAPGTRLNLALCEESLGNWARAWQLFRSLTTRLPPDDERLALVREHLGDLDQRVPRLKLHAAADLPPDAVVYGDGLSVTRDGFDVPIPLDPGRHVLWVDAPAHVRQSYDVELREYERVELAVSPGAPLLQPVATPAAEPVPLAMTPPDTAADAAKSRSHALRTAGSLTLASGAASLLASAALGYVALQHANAMQTLCQPDGSCTPAGGAAAHSGDVLARAATVAFAVGLTLAATGVTVLVLSGAPDRSATSHSPLPRGTIALSLGGAY